MSNSFSVARARAKLTRRGKKVAFMTAYERFREEHDLAEVGVERGWADGLRDRDVGRDLAGA